MTSLFKYLNHVSNSKIFEGDKSPIICKVNQGQKIYSIKIFSKIDYLKIEKDSISLNEESQWKFVNQETGDPIIINSIEIKNNADENVLDILFTIC